MAEFRHQGARGARDRRRHGDRQRRGDRARRGGRDGGHRGPAQGGRGEGGGDASREGLLGGGHAVDVMQRRRHRAARLGEVKQKHGRLEILVTSAGTNRRKPTLEYDEASWDIVVGTNLKGAFFTAQAAAKAMKEGGYGRIIHIGSVASRLASPFQSGYCASKAGLDRLAMVMAIELAPHGITVQRHRTRALPHAAQRAPLQGPALAEHRRRARSDGPRRPAKRSCRPRRLPRVSGIELRHWPDHLLRRRPQHRELTDNA